MVHHVVIAVIDTAAIRSGLNLVIDGLLGQCLGEYAARPRIVTGQILLNNIADSSAFIRDIDLFRIIRTVLFRRTAVEAAHGTAVRSHGFLK